MSELLRVDELKVHFAARSFLGGKRTIRAVDGVSLTVGENEAVGIIGESGCGKTTTGRAIVHLEAATSGRITYRGQDVTHPDARARRGFNEKVQFVFQDPMSSLNPRMSIEQIVAEPLRAFNRWNRKTGPGEVGDLLEKVGLPRELSDRYPHEFSGGQRQRIGIARALALGPELLVLDEPVSALDVSVQAQVLNLLMDLRAEQSLAYIMISHDLDVIRHVTDRILVMYLGVIVESGPADELLDEPFHPYTAALVSATPPSSPDESRERIRLQGELPSAANPPSGCRFRTRCWRADEKCVNEVPPLAPVDGGSRSVACHHPLNLGMPLMREEATA